MLWCQSILKSIARYHNKYYGVTSIPDSSVNISKFSWVITGISIIWILSQQKGSLTYCMANDFLCISNFRKPRQEKESLVAPSEKISPYIFVVNLLFLFRRDQAFWGVCAHQSCPMRQNQKVSSWSLCQVRFQLLFPSLSKNLVFSCKFWQSACDTSDIKNTLAFREKGNHLDGAAPLRKQRREHIILCTHFTLRHITSQVPPVFHSSQNSAWPPTHFLANWLTQKSSREAAATAGRKRQAQLAKQNCVGRSCLLGTKRVSYGLPWNEQCNGVGPQRSWEERVGKKEHTKGKSFLLLLQLTPLNFLPPPGSPVSKNNLYKGKKL